jgi:hypothetical protein
VSPWIELFQLIKELGAEVVLPAIRELKANRAREAVAGSAAGRAAYEAARAAKPVNYPAMVYVAGPFSAPSRDGVEQNIRKATAVALNVARLGGFPVTPHANTSHPTFEVIQPYEFWVAGTMSLTMSLLHACDALITVPGWEGSRGATNEVREMRRRGKPTFHELSALRAWLPKR